MLAKGRWDLTRRLKINRAALGIVEQNGVAGEKEKCRLKGRSSHFMVLI
jgi:hypothetical protein